MYLGRSCKSSLGVSGTIIIVLRSYIFRTCQEHRDAITDVAFSPDGFLLASTCIAGDVALYDLRSGATCLLKDNAHDLGALSCCFASRDFLPSGTFSVPN